MAGKKNMKPVKAEPVVSQDPLQNLKDNIKPISVVVISILIVVIIVLVYTNYTTTRENDSWQALSVFQTETMQSLMVDQGKVQEFLAEIDGTTAEPWALSYCTSLYFNKRDFDRASQMLDRLNEKYENHYICKETDFYETARSMINKELEWVSQNKPVDTEPVIEEDNS